ncbi:MAG TPA: tetratricopeptide repeat protein, partial [Draconibacterium sp.]|nr:tetratricopeptide repeat protein [Draconibacterium sp.]
KMKKTIILLALVLSFSAAFAQKGKVTSAQNFKDTGKLDEAVETIENTIDPANDKAEKTIPWPKTWEVRGEIYQAVFKSQDESVKALSDDPLTVALESYKKAIELDESDKFSKSVKIKLTLLINDLADQAVEAFNTDDYKTALKSFEQILEIEDMPLIKEDSPEAVDTIIIFNAGLAAYNLEDYETAIKFYKEAAKHGFNAGRTYVLIADSYLQMQDTAQALNSVQEGFEKYPDDNGVLTNMIDLYMKTGKNEEAAEYLDLAIEQDPQNVTYYSAKGRLFETFGQEQDAINTYEKAIEVDPNHFISNFNLGVLYYNKGVDQYKSAGDIPPTENEKYQAALDSADEWFAKSLPYMEKCYEIDPSEPAVLESLKNLYYRLKDMDKYNEVLELLGE